MDAHNNKDQHHTHTFLLNLIKYKHHTKTKIKTMQNNVDDLTKQLTQLKVEKTHIWKSWAKSTQQMCENWLPFRPRRDSNLER